MQYVSYFELIKHSYLKTHTAGRVLEFKNRGIGYITKGSAEFLFKGNIISADVGDLIYIPSGTRYYSVWQGDPEIEFYEIKFDLMSDYAYFDYGFQVQRGYPSGVFERMMSYLKEKPLSAMAELYSLLSDIYGRMNKDESLGFSDIAPAIDYIEGSFCERISIPELAKMCRMSTSLFFRRFKEITGTTPIAYKHNILIQHALHLLKDTELSVDEISDRLGFSSGNYFRRVFTKITKKTPRECR